MKAIQLMPGVQAGVDGSADCIYAAQPDQNLILLDGTPVYNVDHMFDSFRFYSGGRSKGNTIQKAPFRHVSADGFLLSSTSVPMTEICRKYHGTLSIGLLTSKNQPGGSDCERENVFQYFRQTFVSRPHR